jgi:hypothetical protein
MRRREGFPWVTVVSGLLIPISGLLIPSGLVWHLMQDHLFLLHVLTYFGSALVYLQAWRRRLQAATSTTERVSQYRWLAFLVAMNVLFWLELAHLVPMRGAEAIAVLVVVLCVVELAISLVTRGDRVSRPYGRAG